MKEWSKKPPTEPGYYWIQLTENEFELIKLENIESWKREVIQWGPRVKWPDGTLVCALDSEEYTREELYKQSVLDSIS